MDDFKFKNSEELYRKLFPALNTKVEDLKRHNIKHIKEENIWEYLKMDYWRKSENISLGEMVNDILTTPNQELIDYITKDKLEETDNNDLL